MLGFLLAFATAILESLKDVFSKKNLVHIDEYTAAFSMHLVQSVVLAPVVIWAGVESITGRFLFALAAATVLQLVVILLYMKAIKRSELSTSVPLITLTPLFMLLTSPILIGEFPNATGVAGIVLIVAGTYILNINGKRKRPLAPFLTLYKNVGSRYMLIVAFLWSITSNIDKVGVEETSPIFWAFTKDFVILLYLAPVMYLKSKSPHTQLKSRAPTLMLVGLFRAASVVAQMFAIQYILVAYVIAIKRSSALFIMLWAFFFMNERDYFKTRLAGILIILLGLIVIALS